MKTREVKEIIKFFIIQNPKMGTEAGFYLKKLESLFKSAREARSVLFNQARREANKQMEIEEAERKPN